MIGKEEDNAAGFKAQRNRMLGVRNMEVLCEGCVGSG